MEIIKRKLSKHPSYKDEVPCILIAGKKIAKKYEWKVGMEVYVILEDNGVKITRQIVDDPDLDEIQEETTSMEEKEEKLDKRETK